jgi:hypothetical protein
VRDKKWRGHAAHDAVRHQLQIIRLFFPQGLHRIELRGPSRGYSRDDANQMHSSSAESQADAVLSRAGLEPLRAAWKDARLRVWMKGGMLRMMPLAISFK